MRTINRYQRGGLVSLQNGEDVVNPDFMAQHPSYSLEDDLARAVEAERQRSIREVRPIPKPPQPVQDRLPYRGGPDAEDSTGLRSRPGERDPGHPFDRRRSDINLFNLAKTGLRGIVKGGSPVSTAATALGGGLFGPWGAFVGNVAGRSLSDPNAEYVFNRPWSDLASAAGFRGLSNTQRLSRDYDPYMWARDFFSRTPESSISTDVDPDDKPETSYFEEDPIINREVTVSQLPPFIDRRVAVSQLPPFNQQLPLPMTDMRLIDPLPYDIEHPSESREVTGLPLNILPNDYRLQDPRRAGADVRQKPAPPPRVGTLKGVVPSASELFSLKDFWPKGYGEGLLTETPEFRGLPPRHGGTDIPYLPLPRTDIRLEDLQQNLIPESDLFNMAKQLRDVQDQEDAIRLQGGLRGDETLPFEELEAEGKAIPMFEWNPEPLTRSFGSDPFDVAMRRRVPGQRRWPREQPYPGPYGPEGEVMAQQGGMIPNIALQAGGNPIVNNVARDIKEGINSGIRSLVANAYAQGNVPPPSSPQLNQSQLLNQGLTMAPNTANMPVPQQPQQLPAQSNISNVYAQSTQPQSYYMQPNQIR